MSYTHPAPDAYSLPVPYDYEMNPSVDRDALTNTPISGLYNMGTFEETMNDQQPDHTDGSLRSTNDSMGATETTLEDHIKLDIHNRGSPLYLENITYEVDTAIPSASKFPCAKKKKERKVILQGVNGHVQPTDLLAIMGASGAGKTTMLNIMACRIQPTGGELYLSGVPASQIKEIHRHIAYVMQDDVLMGNLTVKECLKFAARLKLSHLDKTAQDERIEEMLEELGLGRVRDTIIGDANHRGISGGERKRVAIAIELLCFPAILFLDEPTSGLDSFTAESVIGTCKELAERGHTVVATIHQPNSDIFRMFKSVMFLAKGQVVYNGPTEGTIPYFRELQYDCPQYTNPPDYFMKLLRLDLGAANGDKSQAACLKMDMGDARSDLFIQAWKEREPLYLHPKDPEEDLAPPAPFPGYLTQLRALFWRAFLNVMRSKMLTQVRLFQNLFLAVFVGCIFLQLGYDQTDIQARMGAIYYTLMSQTMPALMSVVCAFPAEKAVVKRERGNGMYSLFPYYISKFGSELPFQVLFAVLFTSIFYWLVNLNSGVDRFFIFTGILILLCLTACSLGIFISAMCPTVDVALAVAPTVMMPFILFGGFFAPQSALPEWCAWMKYVDFFYYSFGAALKNEFDGETFTCDVTPCFNTGLEVLERYGFADVKICVNCLIIFAFCIAFQLLGYAALWFNTRKSFAQ